MPRTKYPASYRLSEVCQSLIGALAGHLGVSRTGVIEQAVRKLARAEGLPEPAVGGAGTPLPKRGRKGMGGGS